MVHLSTRTLSKTIRFKVNPDLTRTVPGLNQTPPIPIGSGGRGSSFGYGYPMQASDTNDKVSNAENFGIRLFLVFESAF